MLSNLINPEIAAGHPDYAHNFHLLSLLKMTIFFGSVLGAAVLWMIGCILVIRSKRQPNLWLFLAVLGPFGFAILAMLNDRMPAETDRYAQFVRKMNWYVRCGYELCTFGIIFELAYQAIFLKSMLMIWFEAVTTGVSTAQIIDIRNASSGMWAFGEGMEEMYLVVVFYVLRPIVFRFVDQMAERIRSPKTG
jgi:hypothetical protein